MFDVDKKYELTNTRFSQFYELAEYVVSFAIVFSQTGREIAHVYF
jgi:hypothetical protein